MNQTMFDMDWPGLVYRVNCNLHVRHNTFTVCMKEYGNDMTNLVIDLRQWFTKAFNMLLVHLNTNSWNMWSAVG